MKIRNIYNQITAPTIQDLWLYKGDLRYFGNRGWQSLFPDYSKNFEEINTQIDTINKQLDAIESTTASINYDSNTKKIQLLSNGSVISEIDATVFIKDGMVSNVTIDNDTKIVTITFNTDAGKEDIEVDFSDIYDVLSDKIGSNTFTDANYISKETNLTDAVMQLDEEIKATNDNMAILNAASVKGIKIGSNTTSEAFSSGIVTLANATGSADGTLSKEDKTKLDNIGSTYLPLTGGTLIGPLTINNGGLSTSRLNMGTRGSFFSYNSDDNYIRLDQYFRPNGFKWVSFGYANISGTGAFCIREEEKNPGIAKFALMFADYEGNTYKFLNDYNFKAGTDYIAPSTLNNYLPLSGGTLTGILKVPYTGIQTDGGNSIIFFNSSELFIGNSNFRGIWETTNRDLIHRRVGTNYTIIDTYNTFNTITYTTSASEDNLRAWNNYVNGYVTNLRIVDNALTSYTRVVNGVDIENKKFDVYIIGGDPVRLVRAEYTLADNGSVTTSTNAYTLTPVTV